MRSFHLLAWLLLAWLLWSVMGCTNFIINPDSKKVDKMAEVIFFNDYTFNLPATPGDSNTIPVFDSAPAWYGFLSPHYRAPSLTNPDLGCSDDSNIQLVSYRYTFIGALGLRPGVTASNNGFRISMNRKDSTSPNPVSIALPFTESENWIPFESFLQLVESFEPYKTPANASGGFLSLDTRNLQSLYYGQEVIMRVEIKAICSLTPGW